MEQKDNTIWIGLGIFAAIGLFWYLSRQQKLIQPTQISNSEVWNWTDYKEAIHFDMDCCCRLGSLVLLKVVFERARQVGVAGPRRSHRAMLRRVAALYRQFFLPVLPVAVDDFNRDGRADGLAVAHAGEHMRLIGFDLHAAAAAVALLPAPQLAVHEFEIDGDAGGQP